MTDAFIFFCSWAENKQDKKMKKIKQGYNIVFLWNKKEPIENISFQEVHKEIVEIFKEADLFEKN